MNLLAATDPTALTDACGDDPHWFCERVFDWTDSKTWARFGEWVVAKPITLLVVVIAAALIARLVRWSITRSMKRLMVTGEANSKRRKGLRRRTSNVLLSSGDSSLRMQARFGTLNDVFRSIGTALVWLVAIVVAFDVIGVSLGPIIATAGIAGVALGFGTQTMVRDFISGFFIVAEDQFGVGDTIDLGNGAKGIVERVTLRSTHLRDSEGTVWHVSNGQITRVANKSQEWARALIDVVLPYNADIDAVSAVMQEVADSLQTDPKWGADILERAELWGIQEFDADGVHVRLVIKTKPAAQFAVLRELRSRLKTTFDERGIDFAYAGGPTQVVITDESSLVPKTSPQSTVKPNFADSDGTIVGQNNSDGSVADGDGD